jgi:Xaa-Pro aminopeptidase
MDAMIRPISEGELGVRRRLVAVDLDSRGLGGALVSDPANVRYLGGFALGQPWHSRTRPTACVLAPDGTIAVVTSSALRLDDPPVDRVTTYVDPADAPAAIARALADAGLTGARVGAELGHEHRIGMAVDQLRAVERIHGSAFLDAGPSLWAARTVKSPAEVERLRAACAVADRVYARLFAGELRAGESERAIAARVCRMMLEEGADEPGWAMVVSGRGSYDRLLATPRERPIARGEMVWLDIACRVDGYWSDHSRAGIVGGQPDAEQLESQERTIAATRRGIAAVRPGTTLGAVAEAATIAGEATPGRVGHGLGLGSTEPPDVIAGSTLELVPGMVFTVEPLAVRGHGLYQAEAVVCVTADGCEVLTRAPEAISTI